MSTAITEINAKSARGNGRILHLTINEKFIDHAHVSFENAAPGRNDYFIFFDEHVSLVKSTPYIPVRYRDRLGWRLYKKIAEYDFVVVHCLHPFWISVINACPDSVFFVWIGWGADYYDIVYPDPDDMLLRATRQDKLTYSPSQKSRHKFRIGDFIRKTIEAKRLNTDKYAAIKKIKLFSPVIPDEYDIVKNAFASDKFPTEISWNYGSLEEVLVRGFTDKIINGRNILIGNSASHTSNQLDVINWLSAQTIQLENRQIICPLSYGDLNYGKRVATYGQEQLDGKFVALTDYLPLSEYIATIQSCSHLIMNHVRQQGVGNVVIMLYLGAMVFLREESPTFQFLRRLGMHVFSIQQLQKQPALLSEVLETEKREHNLQILYKIWSKSAIDRKTEMLIEAAELNRRHTKN